MTTTWSPLLGTAVPLQLPAVNQSPPELPPQLRVAARVPGAQVSDRQTPAMVSMRCNVLFDFIALSLKTPTSPSGTATWTGPRWTPPSSG